MKKILCKRQAQTIYDICALLLNVTNLFEDSKERNNTDKLYKLSSAKNKKHKLLKIVKQYILKNRVNRASNLNQPQGRRF